MKRSGITILTFAGILLTAMPSCKKNKSDTPEQPQIVNTDLANGLPQTGKAINGYLYSSVQTDSYTTGSPYYSSYAYATFSDPAKNLFNTYNHYTNQNIFQNGQFGGNINVGSVSQNGYNLNISGGSSSLYYMYSNSSAGSLNYNVSWADEGNKTFKPINISLNRGYPTISSNALSLGNSINKGSDFTINLGNYITNYDSLIVIIQGNSTNNVAVKSVPQNATAITFTMQDMINLSTTSYGKITICAINYSNITINSKVNVFELNNTYSLSNVSIY